MTDKIKVDEQGLYHEGSVSLFLNKRSGKFDATVRGVEVEADTLPALREAVEETALKLRRGEALDWKPVIFLQSNSTEFWGRSELVSNVEGRWRGGSFGFQFHRAEHTKLDNAHVLLRPFLRAAGLADADVKDGEDPAKHSETRRAALEKLRRSRAAARKDGRDVHEVWTGAGSSWSRDVETMIEHTPERWEALLFLERMVASAMEKLEDVAHPKRGAKMLDEAVAKLAAGGGLALLPAPVKKPVDPGDPQTFVGRVAKFLAVGSFGTGRHRVEFTVGDEVEILSVYGGPHRYARVRALVVARAGARRREADRVRLDLLQVLP